MLIKQLEVRITVDSIFIRYVGDTNWIRLDEQEDDYELMKNILNRLEKIRPNVRNSKL